MTDTRTVHDPFLGKDVEVSDKLVDRLRGKYAVGPMLPKGEPEFGWRQHEVPPIQHEAAAKIERLDDEIALLRAERDAADDVSRTGRRYVAAMERRLDEVIGLLRPFAALGPICDHFKHHDLKTICSWTIKGVRQDGPTAKQCRAAHDFIAGTEAEKS